MKLPERKYVPKNNEEKREYTIGWNTAIEEAEYLSNKYGDVYAIQDLLEDGEIALRREKEPWFKGAYECILEIEKLNKITKGKQND